MATNDSKRNDSRPPRLSKPDTEQRASPSFHIEKQLRQHMTDLEQIFFVHGQDAVHSLRKETQLKDPSQPREKKDGRET